MEKFGRIRKMKGHKGVVNSIDAQHSESNLIVSGSDDMTVKLWDARVKQSIASYELEY